MIDPLHSLAFSVQANPGVYAVLIGSGVSRSAQIPTGWEITLDFVCKLVTEIAGKTLRFLLPGGDELPINIEVSRLLYQLDRDAYVEALNAARGAPILLAEPVGAQGEP
jgi:hypothetical protein